MKKHTFLTRVLSVVLVIMLVEAMTAVAASAWNNTTYDKDTFGTNGYYNVIFQKDYTLVPGAATETEMVLNNSTGTRRQVVHIMELDPSNPDVSVLPGYYNIDKLEADPSDASAYQAAGVTNVAEYYDTTLGYKVVGAMNTDLDYTDNAPRVLVYNGKNLAGYAKAAAPKSVLYVWNRDGKISCEVTPYNKTTLEAGVADGTLLHAISVSFAMVVENGELVDKKERRDASSDDAARSMVGVKEDGTLVIVMNDGRGANNSKGFNSYEEGEAMLALDCKWAANCDGGGSSSFVTRRAGEEDLVCRCVPCDGAERPTKSSIIITSNVAPTGELDTINIESDYDLFAPNTTYTFGSKALDTHGYAMDLPSDAYWILSDTSFGTISNGTFVSSGKLGEVDIQVKIGDVVYGSKTIEIANPTNLGFKQASTVLPYGKKTTLEFTSLIGEAEVYLDANSFEFSLSNEKAGTINGFEFTATTDESVSSTVVSAKYIPTQTTYTYTINFGKGSQVVWDFEDGDTHGFLSRNDAEQWQTENGSYPFYNLSGKGTASANDSTDVGEKVFIATKENGGQVHNGEKSLAIEFDMTQDAFNEWTYANIFNVEGVKILRDTANGNNATALGMWVYLPKGFRSEENAGSMAIRFDLMAGPDADHLTRTNFNAAYKGKNVNSLTEADIPENRWIYVSTSLSGYNYVRTQDPTNGKEGYSPDLARMYIKPSVAQKLTYYFDNFTIDYSSAVDDRVPPVIDNPQYAPSDTNIPFTEGVQITAASAGFTAYVSDDNSGIDPSTAQIYVDGNKIITKYSGNMIYCSNVALGVGTHKVKFEIADKLGNYTTLTRTIVSESTDHHMQYRTRIELDGHNESGETPMPGSIYYVDVCNNYAEPLGTVSFTLSLSTANEWILDQIIAKEGYEVSYEVNLLEPNKVTFTCKSNKYNSKKVVMFSIPVRVYNPLVTNGMSDGKPVVVSGKSFKAPLTVEMTSCTVAGSYGNYDKLSISELDKVHQIDRHEHTATPVNDKVATCTEPGYTGKTYCEVCKSIADYGTIIPAKGHQYKIIEETLKCESCGILYNGEYEDKMYKDGKILEGWDDNKYYVEGVALVGIHKVISTDGTKEYYYEFDKDGTCKDVYTGFLQDADSRWMYSSYGELSIGWVYIIAEDQWYYFDKTGHAATGTVNIDGRNYKFEGDMGKCLGAWVKTDKGTRLYFCRTYYKNKWAEFDGEKYYFDNNGYRYEGTNAVSFLGNYLGAWEFDEDGKFVQNITGVFKDARDGLYHYAEDGVLFNGGVVKWNDDLYYARSNYSLATTKWFVSKTQANDLVEEGTYEFTSDAKMVIPEPTPKKNGICPDKYGVLCYFIDDVQQFGSGVVEIDGAYYYIRTNGKVVNGTSWFIPSDSTNGLVEEGTYEFDGDGKMIIPEPTPKKNGICPDKYGVLCYFIDDVQQFGSGVVEIDGAKYYVRTNGKVVNGTSWFIPSDSTNGLVEEGTYEFDGDGKMIIPEPTPKKNGICPDKYGVLCYFIDDVQQFGSGIIEIDGDYYYVRTNGKVVNGTSWFIPKDSTNDLVEEGTYQFASDGKMIIE